MHLGNNFYSLAAGRPAYRRLARAGIVFETPLVLFIKNYNYVNHNV
jgi:hypothetical protein